MTKLAELKAAYAASTQGEWWYSGNLNADSYSVSASLTGGAFVADMRYANKANNAAFIALAHNNMAALLEAVVELGRFVEYLGVAGCDGAYDREIERAVNLLENLK